MAKKNKLTFPGPGLAKLSWKIKYGEEELDTVDSLTLHINNQTINIEPDVRERTYNITDDSVFYMEADYDMYSARSGKLHVEIVGGMNCYGSVVTGVSDAWNEQEILSFLLGLKIEGVFDQMIDKEPIDGEIANPGKLVKIEPTANFVPYNKEYKFYCADDSVEQSHPMVMYPTEYGEITAIIDDMGNKMSINSADGYGFYFTQMEIDGVNHNIYIQKTPNAIDAATGVLKYKFIKE